MKRLFAVVAVLLTYACSAAKAPPPAPASVERLTNDTVLETTSSQRGRVLLNGTWEFSPALNPGQDGPGDVWGTIRVPGTWTHTSRDEFPLPGIVELPEVWGAAAAADRAWYRRRFTVPEAWQGRAIELDLARVSTDAIVHVNGKRAGDVRWPFGSVDITEHTKPGENELLIEVLAQAKSDFVANLQGEAAEQKTLKKAKVDFKGLLDDVTLSSRPKGAHVSDVFVITSVRKSTVTLDIELSDVQQAGTIELIAHMMREGKKEAQFEGALQVNAAARQRAKLSWQWDDPALWDLDQPNLYTLRLEARGAGVVDDYPQRFGFREFWIDGKAFVLNGTPFKPRPINYPAGQWTPVNGSVPAIDSMIDGMRKVGFNVLQAWPWDHFQRGIFHFRSLWYERADRKGMVIYGNAKNVASSIIDVEAGWAYVWDKPGMKKRYREQMQAELRRIRNHPSVVMWAASGNFLGSALDQHPRYLGTHWAGLDNDNEGSVRKHEAAEEAYAMIKEFDPTRPVYSHQGAAGDCHTTNHYLNFIPLQEREQWLTHYAEHGEVPFFPVEFGTPLFFSYSRGRNGFDSIVSEPWLTEFAAIYLGADAFRDETDAYRTLVREGYQGGDKWKNWQLKDDIHHSPVSQRLQELFIRNTWRSWRSTGATAGMIPWDLGFQFEEPKPRASFSEMDFVPGQRGAYHAKLSNWGLHYLDPEHGFKPLLGGQQLIANNRDTLAWIAGGAEVADKDHHFWSGADVSKRLALHNDSRSEKQFEASWSVKVAGEVVAQGNETGNIAPAGIEFIPVRFKAPESQGLKTEGRIVMKAKIGEQVHSDELPFRVFAAPAKAKTKRVALYDPVGKTKAMLKALGIESHAWNGKPTDDLVVVGREVYSKQHDLPGQPEALKAHVAAGGRVLIAQQDPEWMRRQWGMRINRYPARRIFALAGSAPVLGALDERDLTDWNGTSSLIEAKPEYERDIRRPTYGFHWGNEGSVSASAVEKPHRSGWRPLLETEFDLQYTPLMELDHGKGRVVMSQLDLEDNVEHDPVAQRLAVQVIDYAAQSKLAPRAVRVVYVGNSQGEKVLEQVGVEYQRGAPAAADLLIVGPGAPLSANQLENLAKSGKRILVLAQPEPRTHYGVSISKKQEFHGSLQIPDWPEARGLSPSDLRIKVDVSYPLITDGAEIGAEGLLARKVKGDGVILYAQLNPELLPQAAYLRLTGWRQLRALSQVLANLGAAFASDTRIFRPSTTELMLAGEWQLEVTQSFEAAKAPAKRYKDSGISAQAKQLVAANADESNMSTVQLPGWLDALKNADGEIVLRKHFTIPRNWAGSELLLKLGPIDDFDETYINGHRIGGVGSDTKNAWAEARLYRIPAHLLRPGKRNVIAVRVFDAFGGGGFGGTDDDLKLEMQGNDELPALYSPDYREDHELGDEPYRYYRW